MKVFSMTTPHTTLAPGAPWPNQSDFVEAIILLLQREALRLDQQAQAKKKRKSPRIYLKAKA
jgi:hypothetical protein